MFNRFADTANPSGDIGTDSVTLSVATILRSSSQDTSMAHLPSPAHNRMAEILSIMPWRSWTRGIHRDY